MIDFFDLLQLLFTIILGIACGYIAYFGWLQFFISFIVTLTFAYSTVNHYEILKVAIYLIAYALGYISGYGYAKEKSISEE